MELGDLAFRLILILFPGVIATILYKKLVLKKKWESIDYGLNTLIFGILSYLILQIIYNVGDDSDLLIWSRLQDNNALPHEEIIYASLLSILVGIGSSVVINHKWINRIATYFKITEKYGEDSLFYNFLVGHDVSEVHVKDPDLNIIYVGYLKFYSEDEFNREIVMIDVDLYEYESAKLINSLDKVYISRNRSSKLIIEIPNKIQNEKDNEDQPS